MRTAQSIHRTGMARMAGVHLVAANEALTPADRSLAAKFAGPLESDAPTHSCPDCGTGYFKPQSCDWCGTATNPVSQPTER